MSALPTPRFGQAARMPLPAVQSGADYSFALPRDARLELARGWLWLGLAALIGSGLFSVLLVLSRTPGINRLLPVADFFHVALVVHVDLSVLVWFMALAGMLWSLNSSTRRMGWGWLALGLAAAGALAMALAPFLGGGEAIMANYIPVITAPLFIAGLLTFAVGVALLVLRSLVNAPQLGLQFDGRGALRFGLNAAAVATAVALLAFGWSYAVLPGDLNGKAYYEILFWGGGHVLQFTWTLLMLVAWLWLASDCGARVPLSPRVTVLMFALALASVFVTPYAYVAYDIATVEHRALLTWAMRLGGGVAIVPVALAVVFAMARAPAASAIAAAAARRPAVVGAAVRRRRRDRHLHQRQQRPDPGALPRLHRRRDPGADGPGLSIAAGPGLPGAARPARHQPALAVRGGAADAHRGPGVVGRLRRAAQGGGRGAGAAQPRRRSPAWA